jgi:hypothetical protein
MNIATNLLNGDRHESNITKLKGTTYHPAHFGGSR